MNVFTGEWLAPYPMTAPEFACWIWCYLCHHTVSDKYFRESIGDLLNDEVKAHVYLLLHQRKCFVSRFVGDVYYLKALLMLAGFSDKSKFQFQYRPSFMTLPQKMQQCTGSLQEAFTTLPGYEYVHHASGPFLKELKERGEYLMLVDHIEPSGFYMCKLGNVFTSMHYGTHHNIRWAKGETYVDLSSCQAVILLALPELQLLKICSC
jgi:hypothetical protein